MIPHLKAIRIRNEIRNDIIMCCVRQEIEWLDLFGTPCKKEIETTVLNVASGLDLLSVWVQSFSEIHKISIQNMFMLIILDF